MTIPKAQNGGFQIPVITTDITYMKNGFCVAGWCPQDRTMRRLMLGGTRYWNDQDLARLGRYAALNVAVIPCEGGKDYPHKTENTPIAEDFTVVQTYKDPALLVKHIQGATSPNIANAFAGQLRENAWVPPHTRCPSLGGVVRPARDIAFFRKDSKPRVQITDSDGTAYALPLSCKYLRDMVEPMTEAQTTAFNDKMQVSGTQAHVRLGLAKPYVHQEGRCYLMCNGIFFT